MTLREALLICGESEHIAEMLRLEAAGFGGTRYQMFILGAPETESDRKQARYRHLYKNAQDALREKLATGEFIATGRDTQRPIDHPRVKVPPDLWQSLVFDFEHSAATADGLKISSIEVSPVGGLRIWRMAKRARLGSVDLRLSPQSYDLLLALAEGALKGPAPVELEELEGRFFQKVYDEKALGQGIAKLKKQMTNSGLERASVVALIRNVRAVGYVLCMMPEEITIEA